jgi:hypothetical protein
MRLLVAWAGVALILLSAGAANAETRAQFCARWNTVCLKTLPPEFRSECRGRLAACRGSGCFYFKAFGSRCETDRLTCSQIHDACVGLGTNPDCDAAKARCMKAGRWIGKGGVDYGPALER